MASAVCSGIGSTDGAPGCSGTAVASAGAVSVSGFPLGWPGGRTCTGLRGAERMYCPKGPGTGAGFSSAHPASSRTVKQKAPLRRHNLMPRRLGCPLDVTGSGTAPPSAAGMVRPRLPCG